MDWQYNFIETHFTSTHTRLYGHTSVFSRDISNQSYGATLLPRVDMHSKLQILAINVLGGLFNRVNSQTN